MRILKINLVFILLCFKASFVNGQINEPTPVSPQIAAFQQYGDINVNLSTGVPNISIPLLELDHFGYKLPISLDYFPTPLRPGYNYDVTGVGWNLSLRSHVSRKMNYLADESKNFVVTEVISSMCTYDLSCLDNHDAASDVFSAKLPDGSSFDFSIVNNNNSVEVRVLNGRPVKVDWESTGNNYSPGITAFEITDESGIIYTFNVPNKLTLGEYYYTEWHLSKIKLPYTDQSITIEYDNFVQSLHYDSSTQGLSFKRQIKFFGNSISECKDSKGNDIGTNIIEQVHPEFNQEFRHRSLLITKINYGMGDVTFTYNKPKKDPIHQNENFYNYLDRIEHEDMAIEFNRVLHNVQGIPVAQLTGLDFKSALSSVLLKKYQFINESINIPNGRTDHWGYYNAAGNGSSGFGNFVFSGPWDYQAIDLSSFASLEIIEPQDMNSPDTNQFVKYQFNRNVPTAGEPGGSHGILKAIIYPTGGKTEFDFEHHKFLSQTSWDGTFIEDLKKREVTEASGWRIKTITNKDSNGDTLSIKNYRYGRRASEIWNVSDITDMEPNVVDNFMVGKHPEKHTNVGEVVVDPTILNFINFTYFYPDMQSVGNQALLYPDNFSDLILGKTGYLGTLTAACQIPFEWEFNMGVKYFQRLLNGRPQVVYPFVTVYDGLYNDTAPESTTGINGKTEYVYDLLDIDENGNEVFIEAVLSEEESGNFRTYIPQTHRYNNLLEQKDYAVKHSNYSLIKKEETFWAPCSFNSFNVFKAFQPAIPYSIVSLSFGTNDHIQAIQDYVQSSLIFQFEDYYDMKPSQKFVTMYSDDGSEITSREEWSYREGGRLTNNYLFNSNGEKQETQYGYPNSNYAEFSDLIDKNIISVPTIVRNFNDDTFVSGVQTKYDANGLPTNIYISDVKGIDTPNNPSTYYKYPERYSYTYNPNGRIKESHHKESGKTNVYLWDSNGNYVMARIENASYSAVSSLDRKLSSYNSLTYFNELKNLLGNDTFITTYTYFKKNIIEQTDPRGYTTYYEYDDFNRLKAVKDADGNILSENAYNYKQ